MSPRDDAEIQRRVGRIEGLIQAIEEGESTPTRDAARELTTALLDFHGAGLARILHRVADAGAPGRAIAEAWARDDLVQGLLALHDLAPREEPGLVQLRMGRDVPVPEVPAPVPDLSFEPRRAVAVPHAAVPTIMLEIDVKTASPEQVVHALLLRCQVRIEPQLRQYTPGEQETLRDLFGDERMFDRSQRPFLWTHAGTAVSRFTGKATAELALPCTYDLAVASARYFDALDGGEAPLLLLFSGTIFLNRADGALYAEPIAWSQEARFALPARVWREAMEPQFPNSAPLLVRRDVFEKLRRHRTSRHFTSWDETLSALLDAFDGERA